MELNVTKVLEWDCKYYAMPVAEGGEDAGRNSWLDAMDRVETDPLVTTEEGIAACKDYFGEWGAWEDEDIAGWSDQQVNAVLLQYIAQGVREYQRFDSYEDYAFAAENGGVSGTIYRGDDGEWYTWIGV